MDPEQHQPSKYVATSKAGPSLPKSAEAVADAINEIKALRIAKSLPVYDLNQGLVRAPTPLISQIRTWHHAAIERVDPSTMSRVAGSTELKRAVAEWRGGQFHERISRENIIITPGANAAWNVVLQSLSRVGDTVALVRPYFFNHHGSVESSGRRAVYIDLARSEREFLAKANEVLSFTKPQLLVLSNPHNPTGILFSGDCLKQLEYLCGANGTLLVIDESYGTLPSSDQQLLSSGDSLSMTNTVVIGSFTKSLCLADLRLGYVIINQEYTNRMTAVADDRWIAVSQVTQMVALDALTERTWVQSLIENQLQTNRRTVDQWGTENTQLAIGPCNHAVFAWLKLPSGVDDVEMVTRMACEDGVMTTPGTAYGTPGFIRLGYGMMDGAVKLRDALDIISRRLADETSTFPRLESFRT